MQAFTIKQQEIKDVVAVSFLAYLNIFTRSTLKT